MSDTPSPELQQADAIAARHADWEDFHRRLDQLRPSAAVTSTIVAINLFIFVLMVLNGAGLMSVDGELAVRWGSNYGRLTAGGEWWRLFTSTFIHYGILHVGLNMMALYQTGRTVERMFGGLHFLALYLCAGISGSLASILWNPGANSAGASGAIFGVFGGLLAFMLNPRNAVPRSVMNEHRNSTFAFIVFNLAGGFAFPAIDNAAHIGGLLGGMLFGFVLARPIDLRARIAAGGKRLLAAAAIAVPLFSGLAYLVAHPRAEALAEQQFKQELQLFAQQDSRLKADTNNVLLLARGRRASPVALAEQVEGEIVPGWSGMRQLLAAPRLTPRSGHFLLQQAALRYVERQQRAARLMAQLLRGGDPASAAAYAEARKDAERAELDMRTLPQP